MVWSNLQFRMTDSPILRYGFAAALFAIALRLALLAQRYDFRNVEAPLFLFAVFVSFSLLVGWFSAIRRWVERELTQAGDHLQIEVAERIQQASLLNLTHDRSSIS